MKKFILIACILILFLPSSAPAEVTWITPVDVTPDDADQWDDVDLSGSIASGSTGVILHILNDAWSTRAVGWRKNGSTDDRTHTNLEKNHLWVAVGVDGSRIVELYLDNISTMEAWLVGYFETDEVFFTNAPDISLSTTTAWTDIDISGDTGGDTAIGAFIEVVNITTGNEFGFRKNGSSDSRVRDVGHHTASAIGVDGSEILEGYIENTDTDFFLTGYCKANTTFNTNATAFNLGTEDAWTDLDALPAGATGGYIEVVTDSYAHWFGLRENGSAENIVYAAAYKMCWGMVECDGSRIIEGYIATLSTDLFLTGYTTAAAPPPPPAAEEAQSHIMMWSE